MPPGDGKSISPEDTENIMHISLPISKETSLMGCDTGGEWATGYTAGNNFSLSVNTDSKEKADRPFTELLSGGSVSMPIANTFWGDNFGSLTDKFGINWMVSFNEHHQNTEQKAKTGR